MSRTLAALLVAVIAPSVGCGDERAVVVDLTVRGDGDRLCLVAWGDGDAVYENAYGDADDAPPLQGSLTFVAGDRVSDELRVTAWLARGGRVVARGAGEASFGTLDSVHLPLPVASCHRRDSPGGMARLRMVGTLSPADGSPLVAVDLDGDGREELLTVADDGGWVVANAEPSGGSLEPLDLPFPAGALPSAAAGLDDDCMLDVLAASADGAIVVRSPGADGETLPAVGPPAAAVTVGDFGGGEAPTLAIAGGAGLTVVPWRSDETTAFVDGDFTAVAAADLTGDGLDDLVVAGAAGTRVLLGSGAGPTEIAGAVPASFATVQGPIALGDLDGDGATDLVGAADTALRIARNRGDGLLEDRTGPAPPELAATVTRLVVADLTGDCLEDVVAVDSDGAIAVLRSEPGLRLTPESLSVGAVQDAAAADVDGDGARELALLLRNGTLVVWGR